LPLPPLPLPLPLPPPQQLSPTSSLRLIFHLVFVRQYKVQCLDKLAVIDTRGKCIDNSLYLNRPTQQYCGNSHESKDLVNHFWISQNLFCFGRSGASEKRKLLTKTHIAKQSKKYPNHHLLVHNLHTMKQNKKEKKGEIVFVGWKVRPNAAAYNRPSVFFFLADLSYVGFVPVGDLLDIKGNKKPFSFWHKNKS
jgi:hypothetical protein